MVGRQNIILLSIKPRYAKAIFDGTKRMEFRRKIFKRPVDHLVLYSTNPEGKVIGAISISKIIEANPKKLWDKYNKVGHINKDNFFEYFRNCDLGYGLEIVKTNLFNKDISLRMVDKGLRAPQSYVYLSKNKIRKIERLTGCKIGE